MPTSDALRKKLYLLADDLVPPPVTLENDLQALDNLSRRPAEPVTIALATFDDFDGTYFTLAALHLTHPEVIENAEILLLDNHPQGLDSITLRTVLADFPKVRYVPVRSMMSTAVRDLAFHIATGEIVVLLDSHVLIQPGGLSAVVKHLSDPDCWDLVQGPLLRANGKPTATHMNPLWRHGMYGYWGFDERLDGYSDAPFEIPLHGLGVFASRRDAWPGFHPQFAGFGGEEGYIHEKFRQAGGRTVCLPAFGWVHRFGRPRGVKYDLRWESRARNYVLGWTELGMDVDSVRNHLADFVGGGIGPYIDRVRADIRHPLWRYDGIVVLNDPIRPGNWRRATEILDTISMIPRRLPMEGLIQSADSSAYALAAGRRYAGYWGWRNYAVLGDEAVVAAGDADGLLALLDGPPRIEDTPFTLVHSTITTAPTVPGHQEV